MPLRKRQAPPLRELAVGRRCPFGLTAGTSHPFSRGLGLNRSPPTGGQVVANRPCWRPGRGWPPILRVAGDRISLYSRSRWRRLRRSSVLLSSASLLLPRNVAAALIFQPPPLFPTAAVPAPFSHLAPSRPASSFVGSIAIVVPALSSRPCTGRVSLDTPILLLPPPSTSLSSSSNNVAFRYPAIPPPPQQLSLPTYYRHHSNVLPSSFPPMPSSSLPLLLALTAPQPRRQRHHHPSPATIANRYYPAVAISLQPCHATPSTIRSGATALGSPSNLLHHPSPIIVASRCQVPC
ncbi:hypothetical protein B296_00032962 [Ensete ventricosum]|uniref:Uncharacterized protein n=1 Tax=Ensete ventricosum TaxID=4639 RepID=A0A426WY55_ENSVE|nr:hypothetical protein B296_00032962 [Ensete ventricosum]